MFNPHSLNGDRLERYHDLHLRGKYPLAGRSSLPMDLSAMKTSTWTYKPALPLQAMVSHHQPPAPEKQIRFRPEKAHRRPVQRLQWRKSKWQGDPDEPSSYLDLNRISSMTIADVSPKFAVKRILQMYENQQYREAANFVNRLSHGTFKVILTDLPVDVFIESMPDSLPILEALYAKVFLSDGLNFSVKTLKPDAVVMQMVKFFAQQEDSLTGNIKWDKCGTFIVSCKKLLKVIIHTDPKIKKMLVGRRKALDKAIEGMGHHGMVGTSDGSLMNLHDALKLEFKKVVTSYKAALEKLEELSLSTSSKQTISRSISHGPAPIQVSHQRQLSITQQEIQERLIKNKTILNVVEPILGNHSLDVFLGILQRRIDHDKDCLFHFTQLKKEVKDMQDATVVVPIMMRYGNGIDQVLKLMRDVSGDQEESDGSDISGYHSDSDSAIMTSGNSPYVSKSARYNFLYRSVRATPAQFRGGIPAFSAVSSAASGTSSLAASSPPASDTASSVGDKSAGDDTSPQLETKAGGRPRKRREVEKRSSSASADSLASSETETTCSKGHVLPFASDHGTVRRRPADVSQLSRQVESLQGEVRSAQLTINRCNERERQLKHKLSEQHQHQGRHEAPPPPPQPHRPLCRTTTTENVTSIAVDSRAAGLVRRFSALYSHGRAEAMAALDALPELRHSDELKSKLLFSVVVLAFRSVTAGQQAVREAVRRQLQIPPPPPTAGPPQPPGRGDAGAASERSTQLEATITGFLQQTVDTYDLSSSVEEVCSQIWATLYDYPSLRTTEGLLSYVKESVRLAWGLINQTPPCRIEYEVRQFSSELHVRHQASDAGQSGVQTYVWPALLEGAVCVHKAVVIT